MRSRQLWRLLLLLLLLLMLLLSLLLTVLQLKQWSQAAINDTCWHRLPCHVRPMRPLCPTQGRQVNLKHPWLLLRLLRTSEHHVVL